MSVRPPDRLRDRLRRARATVGERGDRGQVTALVTGLFAALWLFAGIVVDGGLALAGKAQSLDVAQEAARTGAQQLDIGRLRRRDDVRLVRADAHSAARRYAAATGNTASITVKGDTVTVQVTHHQRTQILQLIGLRTLTVQATATAHAQRVASNSP